MVEEKSEIVQFFKGQSVFITGGTGFVGKVIIEKLLRVCQDLNKIYVLIRPKRGKTMEERFDTFFDFPCFDNLKSCNPHYKSQIKLISGDLEKPQLGMNLFDIELLKSETTCIIHAAASINFDQGLRDAAETNVRPLIFLLDLAKQMSHLKVFVHISTTYSNCNQCRVKEKFYESPMNPKALLSVMDALDEKTIEIITPRILGEWPNSYAFTKAVAENLIKTEGQDLPIVIVRPSLVTSSLHEPIPGWIENLYGIVSVLIAATAIGALRSIHADQDQTATIIPVDYVSNEILAAAWDVGTHKRAPDEEIPILHSTNSKTNNLTWKQIIANMDIVNMIYPSQYMLWYPFHAMRKCYWWHRICIFFLHTLVAHIMDLGQLCRGKPATIAKKYARVDKLLLLLSYFSLRKFDFATDNMKKLWAKMGPIDQKLFDFDVDAIDMATYLENCALGGRIYLLKDPLETVPQGKRKLKILRAMHYALITLFWFLMYMLLRLMLHVLL